MAKRKAAEHQNPSNSAMKEIRELLSRVGNDWADFESMNNVLMFSDYSKQLPKRNYHATQLISAMCTVIEAIAEHRGFDELYHEVVAMQQAFLNSMNTLPRVDAPIPQIGIPPPRSGPRAIQSTPLLSDRTLLGPLALRPHHAMSLIKQIFLVPNSIRSRTELAVFTVPQLTYSDKELGIAPPTDPEWLLCRAQDRAYTYRTRALETLAVIQIQYPHGWDEDQASFKIHRDKVLPTLDPAEGMYYGFEVGEPCMAMFPDTTTFYTARVLEKPSFDNEWCYSVKFETDDAGSRPIFCRFVIPLLVLHDGQHVLHSDYAAPDHEAPTKEDVLARLKNAEEKARGEEGEGKTEDSADWLLSTHPEPDVEM